MLRAVGVPAKAGNVAAGNVLGASPKATAACQSPAERVKDEGQALFHLI